MKKIVSLIAAETDTRKQHQLMLSTLSQLESGQPDRDGLSRQLAEIASGSESYSSDENRIAAILSAVMYEMLPRGEGVVFAEKCMDLVKDFHVRQGLTCSEPIYRKLGRKNMSVAKEVPALLLPQHPDEFRKYTGETHILALSDEEELFAYRETSGTLVLAMLLHQTESFIASDFEMYEFSQEVPLCFTQTTHYHSPMYRLKGMRDLMCALMAKYGYPRIRIKLQAFHTCEGAIVENADENARCWHEEDMEYVYPSSFPNGVIQGMASPVYPHALLTVIKDAKKILAKMPAGKVYTREQIQAWVHAGV